MQLIFMSANQKELIGQPCKAVELNIFQKKFLKKSYAKKTPEQIFIEFKQMIKQCVNNFALDFLINNYQQY